MDFDSYFRDITDVVRNKSKDPSTHIGAIIIGPDKQVISTGFNGFPRGIDETDPLRWERPIKYQYVVHAERNAIYNAVRIGIALNGLTMHMIGFGPLTVPCTECAKAIIQSGIARFVGHAMRPIPESWAADLGFAKNLLVEAGVVLEEGESLDVRE